MHRIDTHDAIRQMSYRKTGNGVEIKARYDEGILSRLAASPRLAPLVEDCIPGEPDFHELKDADGMKGFLKGWKGEPRFTVYVRSKDGENVEKTVCLIDDQGRACAVSTWRRGEGMSFDIVQ